MLQLYILQDEMPDQGNTADAAAASFHPSAHLPRERRREREEDGPQGCQMAKFDPFLSLDCARVEGVGAQSKERKGSNFAA